MRKRPIVVVLTLSIASTLTAACGKKAGGSCKGTESTCSDKKTALACRGGAFVEVACSGPLGCSKYEDHANCDTSVAVAGDACLGEDDEYACSPDRGRAVKCEGGKFAPWLECRGKAGCTTRGHAVSCDTSIAEIGDACKVQGAFACGGDRKHMVVCRDGRFTLYRQCRGERGCDDKGEAPTCDLTLALAGDPCEIPGQLACAVDGKSELVCQGGVFMKSLTCKTACTVTNRPSHPIDCR